MSAPFGLHNLPWMNNVRNAVDSVVHDFSHVAEGFGFRPNNPNGDGRRREFRPSAPRTATPATATATAQPPESQQKTPPASTRAIRQLPTIRVAPEDLVEPSNRECCICLEENRLGEKVTRLPCAHIYHCDCIVDWLSNHHCTCPVCRYELPTDNPIFEAGRQQRMATRKPRFAMYELKRLSVPQLLALNQRPPPPGIVEKKDLIQKLIDSELIVLIPTPEPVEYKLENLKSMRISELKRVMEDAGVFFHSKDVIEKSDMLTIFQNSGRLNLLPADSENAESEIFDNAPPYEVYETPYPIETPTSDQSAPATFPVKGHHMVETVEEDSDAEDIEREPTEDEFLSPPLEMFGSFEEDAFGSMRQPASAATSSASTPVASRSESPASINNKHSVDGNRTHEPKQASRAQEENADTFSTPFLSPSQPVWTERNTVKMETANLASPDPAAVDNPDPYQLDTSSPMSVDSIYEVTTPISEDSNANQTKKPLSAFRNAQGVDHFTQGSNELEEESQYLKATHQDSPNASAGVSVASRSQWYASNQRECPMQEYSISQLQNLAKEASVDLSSCCERREMVDLLLCSGVTAGGQPSNNIQRGRFANWSVSQLRALASELKIDLSQCVDRAEMLDRMLVAANTERPHLKGYLRSLSPLASSSLSQLRGMAREWRVDISDCLEKEEIIQRLISRGQDFGFC